MSTINTSDSTSAVHEGQIVLSVINNADTSSSISISFLSLLSCQSHPIETEFEGGG
eukprot:m.135877 g.135877  ORF g.135877 m.135877 type:complete len:56 (+) comp10271_c0_seq1:616-783(+)